MSTSTRQIMMILIMLFTISQATKATIQLKQMLRPACNPCKPGTYQDVKGSAKCTPCPLGTQSNVGGAKKCKKCPMGTFMDKTGAMICNKCNKGGQCNSIGLKNTEQCPLGTYQDEFGKSQCKKCPSGTYNPSLGGDELTDCLACPTKNKCPAKGLKEPIDCPVGTFQDKRKQSKCKPCTLGQQNDKIEQSKCKQCPEGQYGSKKGGVSIQDACTKCKPGFFNPNQGQSSCNECPINSYTNKHGALKCIACGKGEQTAGRKSTKCDKCKAGTSGTYYDRFSLSKNFGNRNSKYQGIKYNTPIANFKNWKILYKVGYNGAYQKGKTLYNNLKSKVDGKYAFVGAHKVGSSTIKLGAQGKLDEIIKLTQGNSLKYHNGVYWYHRKNYSFGFAGINKVKLNSADVQNRNTDKHRLSWHANSSGWRVGKKTSVNSNKWVKIIYYV